MTEIPECSRLTGRYTMGMTYFKLIPYLRAALITLAVSVCVLALYHRSTHAQDQLQERPLERPNDGRTELVVFQTFHGAFLGSEICSLADCGDVAYVWSTLGGATVGLTGSLLAARNGVEKSTAQAVNAGTLWGMWHATAIGSLSDILLEPGLAGLFIAGQSAGLLGGLALERTLRPTSGQVAQTMSAGAWAGVASALVIPMVSDDPTSRAILPVLAASDLGLVAGAFWASRHPMTRSRTRIINLTGVLGAGLGATVAWSADASSAGYAAGTLAGIGAGLVAGQLLTPNWDKRKRRTCRVQTAMTRHNLQLTPAPTKAGLTLQLTGTL